MSPISTSYNANCTTVTDEAGKLRTSCADGLGRMTGVWEDPSHLNYETDYTYDAMNNLLSVAQKGGDSNSADWRPRSFVYDSLSRLTSATNPESGNILYAYSKDSSGCSGDPGTLCTKTAPSPNQASTGTATVTTTYTYDALDRVTQKAYTDGYQSNTTTPSAFFLYDQQSSWGVTQNSVVGRVSEEWTGTSCCATAGAEIFGYDPMGRIAINEQYTPNMGYMPVNYTYDFAGDMTTATNGVGVTLTYGYDAATRPTSLTSSISDSQHPGTLATVDSANGYYPNGALRKLTYGNGLTVTSAYNNRLQPCRLNVNSSSTALGTCSDTPSGTVLDFNYGFNLGAGDNGNLVSWVGTGNQNFTRTYAYDGLNRLFTLTDSASNQACKGLQWSYDPCANMTSQAVTSGSCLTFSASVTTHNQLVGYTYDAAGNMIRDGSHTYFYDAENRLIQVDGTLGTCSTATACYAYDAEGRRVEKLQGSNWNDRVYDLGGRVVTELRQGPVWQTGYVYFSGQLLAEYNNSTTYFTSSDHLGSTRLMTGVNASVYDSMDYLPFGAQIAGDTGTTHKFTGKERDSETGLDKFGARTYGSAIARFSTPDPLNTPALANTNPSLFAGLLSNPQNWNSYQYAHNSPLSKSDMGGFLTIVVPGTWWAPREWHDGSQFMNQVERTFGEKPVLFKWTGKLSASARHEAAYELRDLINHHHFKPGERLNIVTHSHGSNVGIEMTSLWLGEVNHPINNLVTLGLPVMQGETVPNMSLIQNWINVWSPHDGVAPLGSDVPPGVSPQTVPQANNVEADEARSHSDLWQNPNVWTSHVLPYIPCYASFGDNTVNVPSDVAADASAFYPGASGYRMNNQY